MSDEKDMVVRRDRIEKYKEERRLALRQKYQVDGDINDQKDEEMIRRFKQKIQKNEKNSQDFDSSPSDGDVSAGSIESMVKDRPAAVTTISILYTSRRKRDSVEADKDEKTNQTKDSSIDVPAKNDDKLENSTRSKHINSFVGNNEREYKPGSLLKSFSTDRIEPVKEWPLKNCEGRRPFTASLERKMKNSGVESLVAKRVNQLSEASESSSEISRLRKSGEVG